MVDLVGMKIIYLAVMFIITVVCGIVPVKILQCFRSRARSLDRFTAVLSILSCFAGGVFLGVALLDMLPDALESFEEFKTAAPFDSDLPLPSIVIGVGFFFIYLFDLLPSTCGHGHSHDVSAAIDVSPVSSPSTPPSEGQQSDKWATPPSVSPAESALLPERGGGKAAYLKSLTFILSFLLHVLLEGFALGIQKTEVAGFSLFIGIILHKGIAAFSIGTRLHQNHPTNSIFVAAMLVFVATVCTIGGVIGMLLKDASMSTAAKAGVESMLSCISIGTFLYITFFEILAVEKGSLAQRLAAVVGFVVIGIPAIFLPSV